MRSLSLLPRPEGAEDVGIGENVPGDGGAGDVNIDFDLID